MKIYPKTSERLEGLDKLISFVEKYKGIELQYFDKEGTMNEFDIEPPIEKLMEKVPYIKEITIHPPLLNYDIECIMMKDINIIKKQLRSLRELSEKYNIKLNINYHTEWNFKVHKETTIDLFKEILKEIEGTNVILLIENLYMFDEDKCCVFELANYINHPNLKVCFDICHMYCKVNIYKTNVESYIKNYLNKEICRKFVYQVHFSYTTNNDGYVERNTHGRVHRNIEELKYDYELMKSYGMGECNYITEISEEDYSNRVDQLKELEMLEKVK